MPPSSPRSRRPFRSLQSRMLALVTGLVLLTWTAVAVWTWVGARHELDELLDAHLAQAAALLVGQQTAEFEEDHAVDAPLLHRYAPRVAFQVFREGRLHLRSSNAPRTPLLPFDEWDDDTFRDVDLDRHVWRVFTTSSGDVRVLVAEQKASRTAILRAVMEGVLAPMLLALPVLAVAIGWGVAGGLRPVKRLASLLRGRQPGDLSPLQLPAAPAELSPLLDALNAQFERLGDLLDSERRFTADAAHELRTPIAAIRAQAQVALGEADEGLRRQALLSTIEGCDRASRLVEQLLTLARLEAEPGHRPGAVDLMRLARDVIAEMVPKAQARRQSLELDAAPGLDLSVPADETLMKVLLRNLVDNALRYSPPGCEVQVAVGRQDRLVSLVVRDRGPGMKASDLARLGERFFRVSSAGAPGSGLGWSIVRRIVGVHGGSVSAHNRADSGLEVRVQLPAA